MYLYFKWIFWCMSICIILLGNWRTCFQKVIDLRSFLSAVDRPNKKRTSYNVLLHNNKGWIAPPPPANGQLANSTVVRARRNWLARRTARFLSASLLFPFVLLVCLIAVFVKNLFRWLVAAMFRSIVMPQQMNWSVPATHTQAVAIMQFLGWSQGHCAKDWTCVQASLWMKGWVAWMHDVHASGCFRCNHVPESYHSHNEIVRETTSQCLSDNDKIPALCYWSCFALSFVRWNKHSCRWWFQWKQQHNEDFTVLHCDSINIWSNSQCQHNTCDIQPRKIVFILRTDDEESLSTTRPGLLVTFQFESSSVPINEQVPSFWCFSLFERKRVWRTNLAWLVSREGEH